MKRLKVETLFVIWLIALFSVGLIVAIFSIKYSYENGLPAMDLPNTEKLIVCFIALFLFFPMLCIICYRAIVEKKKAIKIISIYLCLHILACTLSTIIPILQTY